jgi:hypothetical protein
VAEPQSGRRTARETARNASSGIRRRLRVFLSSDAVRLIQAGGFAWVLAAVGFVAGVLLIISEFMAIRYVTTITASCSDLAEPRLRDNCLLIGHESHHWAFAILGLFVILMSFGAVVGGSRPAAVALLVAGALGLGITLLHDLPNTNKPGEVGAVFAEGRAHKGTGFWLELVGSSLALACGAFTTWRTPPRRTLRARLAEAEPPPEPGDAPA